MQWVARLLLNELTGRSSLERNSPVFLFSLLEGCARLSTQRPIIPRPKVDPLSLNAVGPIVLSIERASRDETGGSSGVGIGQLFFAFSVCFSCLVQWNKTFAGRGTPFDNVDKLRSLCGWLLSRLRDKVDSRDGDDSGAPRSFSPNLSRLRYVVRHPLSASPESASENVLSALLSRYELPATEDDSRLDGKPWTKTIVEMLDKPKHGSELWEFRGCYVRALSGTQIVQFTDNRLRDGNLWAFVDPKALETPSNRSVQLDSDVEFIVGLNHMGLKVMHWRPARARPPEEGGGQHD